MVIIFLYNMYLESIFFLNRGLRQREREKDEN